MLQWCNLHPTHAASTAPPRFLPPRPRRIPGPGERLKIAGDAPGEFCSTFNGIPPWWEEDLVDTGVPRALWVSSGHLESAAGAGGQPESGVLRGAAWVGEDDANTAGKPQASSGSPLGPPCDFETGAPNHSLETVTPLASSRGRWRLRHRASQSPSTLLAGCQAMGGVVRTWVTAEPPAWRGGQTGGTVSPGGGAQPLFFFFFF